MNYFTPDRYVALQDLPNEAAMQAWEQATEAYASHVQQLCSQLPTPLREFVESSSLHDARLLAVWQEPPGHVLRMILQKDCPFSHVIEINYDLAAVPQVIPDALPEHCRSASVLWLYDEIDIETEGSSGDTAPIFNHAILLSNGCEIKLYFRRLQVHRHPILHARLSPTSTYHMTPQSV